MEYSLRSPTRSASKVRRASTYWFGKNLAMRRDTPLVCSINFNLFMDLDLIPDHSGPAEKLAAGLAEFQVYIRNNQESISIYGTRYRQGDTVSTAFVESTINQLVSRRFLKKQQMHLTLRGAHLLLQTRATDVNNELEEIFRRWYPLFRVRAKAA